MENNKIEIGQPLEIASKAIIVLHGRGGTAHDIINLAKEFCDDNFYIVAPQAPNNSWYPLSFLTDEKLNEPWLSDSIETINTIIDQISKHISKDQIYLMGFSQGACLALEISARNATKYGGIFAFSGGLIGSSIDEKKYQGNFKETTVFIGISENDPFIPLIRCEETKEVLKNMGADVTLKVYPSITHTINEDEIAWVKNFMNRTS